jgi:hypothetical protein
MYVIRKIRKDNQNFEHRGTICLYGSIVSLFLIFNIYFFKYIADIENNAYTERTNYATIMCLWTNTYTKPDKKYNAKINIPNLKKIKDIKLSKQEYEKAFTGKKFIYSTERNLKSDWNTLVIGVFILDMCCSVIVVMFILAICDYIKFIINNFRLEIIKLSKLKRRKIIDPYDEEDWRK